ncbi:virulence-associated E family protein [Macrococcoides bohemicum]|uniref:virulence-associated E family protein n=1 Tax=Macrococcoides bohemicum TaxID=1903056 RepID=UPI003AFFD5D6
MFHNDYNIDYQEIKNKLFKDEKGKIQSNIYNLEKIFKEDKNINGLFGVDERTDAIIYLKDPPWNINERSLEKVFDIKKDIGLINNYLIYNYNFKSKSLVKDFVFNEAIQNYIHPVRTYLDNVKWDGTKRVETIFIDYLHAEDNDFIRSVSKKTLIGAVAKILKPGHAHDTTIILSGQQGCGKSLVIKKLAGKWFNDSFDSFKGDEAYIKMAKSWIIELSELTAYNNSGIERIKQVLTSTTDNYRDKYAGESKGHIRDCIFFGTTNEETFLKDETGNRRFIPIKVGVNKTNELNVHDLTQEIVDQVWAEAKEYFLRGETNHLSSEEKLYLEEYQKQFQAIDELENEIARYLLIKIPANWDYLSIEEKREHVKNYDDKTHESKYFVCREKISAREIRDVLLKDERIENKALTSKINLRLKKLLKRDSTEKVRYQKYYGQQRGFFINDEEIKLLEQDYCI